MIKRRDFLKIGLAGGSGLVTRRILAQGTYDPQGAAQEWTKYLCPPDDRARDLSATKPSPIPVPAGVTGAELEAWIRDKRWAFRTELFVPPVIPAAANPDWPYPPRTPLLDPPPDPRAHQRYREFEPKWVYRIRQREMRWLYHRDPPYDTESWSWGWEGWDPVRRRWMGSPSTPGPTYHARYGEPAFVRLYNDLPTVGHANVGFALPSTTTHLHNGHTASESDGNPQDWVQPGEFWDHHYANFPSGGDPREKLTTLWYHDHRLDFTAANVYAGLAGFYLLFDDEDSGDETDPDPRAWRLPSGEFDVPLLLQDIKFDYLTPDEVVPVFENWNTDGMLGDMMTVNRVISPRMSVKRRKYRLRILNGGPSRFYQLGMFSGDAWPKGDLKPELCTIITGDGNFLPEPVEAWHIYMSVAQRVDVIVDFSKIDADHLYLLNLAEQDNGAGPSGRLFDPGDAYPLIRFDIEEGTVEDPSRLPDYFRPLPTINLDEVRRERSWTFDYDGGLWTINGKVMDPNRIDAGIDQGSAEIWWFRNAGNDWSHPIHSHFTEFLILEINGKPFKPSYIQDLKGDDMTYQEYLAVPKGRREPIKLYMGGPRRDVATILPGDEIKVFMRWKDFLGKHVMHCHNVVHEDHAMMIRWDIMEPGRGFDEPREAAEVYGREGFDPPYPDDRPPALPHVEDHPGNPVISDG